jgi:hypothetical protein
VENDDGAALGCSCGCAVAHCELAGCLRMFGCSFAKADIERLGRIASSFDVGDNFRSIGFF